ncbi:MAG: hypothetical protein K2G75_02010, partial [Muribaculaceae bacterium]|nr:hypothetical protein [Muribaculaceae bacterium]
MSENSSNGHSVDDGMAIYEEIVNNVDTCKNRLDSLICELRRVDSTGQFLCSTARFLAAVDHEGFAEYLPKLIESAIEKDRERRYISQLLEAIWGADYEERAEELRGSDDCFRR